MSATLALPRAPSTRAIPAARMACIPVLACEGCGDAVCSVQAPVVCVPCVRRRARARRMAATIRARRQMAAGPIKAKGGQDGR